MKLINVKQKNQTGSASAAFAGGIAATIIGIVLVVYGVWAAAYVGSILWAWFVVPVFGLAPLTLPQAWGISILIAYWFHESSTRDIGEERSWKQTLYDFGIALVRPWFVLLGGWICHRFFM